MAYNRIESYGVIGDMHSVALVGINGSIDWCCLPKFDSPSIFAAILDHKKGGFFKISATHEDVQYRQMYLPETNVLVTRFLSPAGVGEIVDFMPVQDRTRKGRHEIVRIVHGVRGQVSFRAECRPAFDYARSKHELHISSNRAIFCAPEMKLSLVSPVELHEDAGGAVADFVLGPNQSTTFVLRVHQDG